MADFCAFAVYSYTAPKADALPGCATPRTAEALRFPAFLTQAERLVHGNTRKNAARTGERTPGISQNRLSSNNLGGGWKTADDWCQHCSQPIERSALRWFGTWLAHTLFMALPAYHRHTDRLWRWLVPYAGAYAFSCHDNGACASSLSHGER